MASRKLRFAHRTVPSGANSITAWLRPSASSWPAESIATILSSVMSAANFTTFTTSPRLLMIGL